MKEHQHGTAGPEPIAGRVVDAGSEHNRNVWRESLGRQNTWHMAHGTWHVARRTSHVAVQPLRETTPAAARAVRRWDLRFHAGVMSRIPATRLTADTR